MRSLHVLVLLLTAVTTACGDAEPTTGQQAAVSPSTRAHLEAAPQVFNVLAADDGKEQKRIERHANERPLPAFEGRTLAGTRLSISSLIGKRMLIFFFNPEDEAAETVGRAVVDLAKQGRRYNFSVVGVGIGSTTSRVRDFAKKTGIHFSVIDDSNARISSALRLQTRLLVLGADAEGYVIFILSQFNTEAPNAEQTITDRLRESLRIPTSSQASSGQLLDQPIAPDFEARDIDGGQFELAELEGRPKVLIFFLHTCPHCHEALAFFKKALAEIPEEKRPVLLGVSLQDRPSAVRSALREKGLDYFRVLMDSGQKIAPLYGLRGGVPDISLIGADGRIVHRSQGWREDRDPALMRMYLAKIAGVKVPLLLSRRGYTGNDACAVCHEDENATWLYTSHARAYDSLVTRGKDRDPECVSCHVVGFDERGGFSLKKPLLYLESVGCETCHGRGGSHLSTEPVEENAYREVCQGCHDSEHSLGFDYDKFLPYVSHDAIASLTPAERAAQFSGQRSRSDLLPMTADFVGSDACESCHASEFETWSKSEHALSLGSLETKKKTADADCLACHTTGYGRSGGFPSGSRAHSGQDLARVGCESCHGPGADHIGEDAKRFGTIVSLGDKCDSCVILQICGTCHDEANDPDFEFQVEEHIERQRHGTTEPGTGKPLGTSARWRPEPSGRSELAQSFERLDGPS